jgi:hypothetical protein
MRGISTTWSTSRRTRLLGEEAVPARLLEGVHLGTRRLRRRGQAAALEQRARAAVELVRAEAHELHARHVGGDHATGPPLAEQADHRAQRQRIGGGRIGVAGVAGQLEQHRVAPAQPGEVGDRLGRGAHGPLDRVLRGAARHGREADGCRLAGGVSQVLHCRPLSRRTGPPLRQGERRQARCAQRPQLAPGDPRADPRPHRRCVSAPPVPVAHSRPSMAGPV